MRLGSRDGRGRPLPGSLTRAYTRAKHEVTRERVKVSAARRGKQARASGGCLAASRRGRTWYTAKSAAEPCAGDESGDVRMGKPTPHCSGVSRKGGSVRELKHLSSARKREDSASSGERKPSSPNQFTSELGLKGPATSGRAEGERSGKADERGESPVPVSARAGRIPEYRRTREIRREAGATTPQG